MASYPTSVKSFTTKNTGDVIQGSHINDVQDEVNAIEAGLLNGTAPLSSSNSTFAALSVTGQSTLVGRVGMAAELQVNGQSSFTLRPIMPPPQAVKVFLDSTVTIGSSASSTLAFLAQDFLTNSSMHSTATNPERLTPQSTGVYHVTAQVAMAANSTGGRDFAIFDSSGTAIGRVVQSSAVDALVMSVTGYKRFDVLGGHVTCRVSYSGVSTMSLSTGSGQSWMALVKL